MTRRGAAGRVALLGLGLALAAWGLGVTLPHVSEGGPGYLVKSLYPVLIWSLLALACIAGLVYLVATLRAPPPP